MWFVVSIWFVVCCIGGVEIAAIVWNRFVDPLDKHYPIRDLLGIEVNNVQ